MTNNKRGKFKIIVGALIASLAIVAIVWAVSRLWQAVAEMDRNPSRSGLVEQLMRRKSKAMKDILDGMIREDFNRLDRGAKWMKSYNAAIEHFLHFPEYERLSDEFSQSLDDLSEAAIRKESNLAKEAVLRLERSCIECHMLLNQRNRSPANNELSTEKP